MITQGLIGTDYGLNPSPFTPAPSYFFPALWSPPATSASLLHG